MENMTNKEAVRRRNLEKEKWALTEGTKAAEKN